MSTNALLVLTTCPDEACARELAHYLINHQLAACVGRLPGMISTFSWEGSIQEEPEVQLLIKTTRSRQADLEQAILARHPYEVPEILALPIDGGLPRYLQWLEACVTPTLLA